MFREEDVGVFGFVPTRVTFHVVGATPDCKRGAVRRRRRWTRWRRGVLGVGRDLSCNAR